MSLFQVENAMSYVTALQSSKQPDEHRHRCGYGAYSMCMQDISVQIGPPKGIEVIDFKQLLSIIKNHMILPGNPVRMTQNYEILEHQPFL